MTDFLLNLEDRDVTGVTLFTMPIRANRGGLGGLLESIENQGNVDESIYLSVVLPSRS